MLWLLLKVFSALSITVYNIPESKIGPSAVRSSAITGDIVNNKLFVYGGSGEKEECQDQLWSFSLDTFTWNILQNLSETPGKSYLECRSGHTLFFRYHNLNLCIFGGKNAKTIFSDLWCYSLTPMTWEKIHTSFQPAPLLSFSSIYYTYQSFDYLGLLGFDIYSNDLKLYM